jgi:hypothetical protein
MEGHRCPSKDNLGDSWLAVPWRSDNPLQPQIALATSDFSRSRAKDASPFQDSLVQACLKKKKKTKEVFNFHEHISWADSRFKTQYWEFPFVVGKEITGPHHMEAIGANWCSDLYNGF